MLGQTLCSRRHARGLVGVAVIGLGLAASAGHAEIYDSTWGTGYSRGTALGGTHENYGSASVGVVRGTIENLDFLRGMVAIRTDGRVVRLNARPQDLAGFNPGDIAGVTFLNYNGSLWLEPNGYGWGYGDLDSYALAGELTGTVSQVNRKTGRVTIAGHTLRAHPEQLDGVYPGSFVSFTYAQIGNTRWVEDISGGGYYGGQTYIRDSGLDNDLPKNFGNAGIP